MRKAARIPRLMIAAPASGCGKTAVVCGLLEAFKGRGVSCVSYKCGPDYIDPMFHRHVLGVPGYNLDSYFLEESQVRQLFAHKAAKAGLALIEGVMGYYDGIAGIDTQASAYDIARITDTPVILLLDGKKSSLSLAAELKGFLEYRTDSRIGGVILNRTSAMMAERLRPCLEELGVRLFGAVPECAEAGFESRHLGLKLPGEQQKLRDRIGRFGKLLEQTLDLDGILAFAGNAPEYRWEELEGEEKNAFGKDLLRAPDGKPFRIGVAQDEAFCFYYQENLDFLDLAGCERVPFSPRADHALPDHLDALLFGGGYPELYAGRLSENTSMFEAIRRAAEDGVKILAECGGFLYLHRTLEGEDGNVYPMVSLIDGEGFRTGKLSRFGYLELQGDRGRIRGHEFHYWDSTAPGAAMKAQKPLSSRNWRCMYADQNLLAGFPHLYYLSAPELILNFLSGRTDGQKGRNG